MSKKSISVLFLLFAVASLAVNLRAPIVAVGPIVNLIQQDLHVSGGFIGILASLPIFFFAFFSPLVPRLSHRIGMENVLVASIFLLAVGIAIRSFSYSMTLIIIGTVLIALAVSVGNVLLPAVAKKNLPENIGLVIGVYSVSMALSSTVATAISVPIAKQFGWLWSLGVWGFVALFALIVWIILRLKLSGTHNETSQIAKMPNMWKSLEAWLIAGFFGIQSITYYFYSNYMPSVMIEKGVNPTESGFYSALFQGTALISILTISAIFPKTRHKQIVATAVMLAFLLGTLGIWFGSVSMIWFWAIVAGLGCSALSVALMLYPLRTQHILETSALSGMTQSAGYFLSAIVTISAGFLYDIFGSWTEILSILVFFLVLGCVIAWLSSKSENVKY